MHHYLISIQVQILIIKYELLQQIIMHDKHRFFVEISGLGMMNGMDSRTNMTGPAAF